MTSLTSCSRRDFLKVTGATTMGSMIAPFDSLVKLSNEPESIPTRPFGKTGSSVSILSLGGSLHLPLAMLRIAFKWGVTYWDTAHSYMGGNSEKRIGSYFLQFPEERKKIFLVTKSGAWTLKGLSDDLNQSLERMKTSYIDLFMVHGVRSISELDEKKRVWAQKAKAKGKIRFFGFSTHTNMETCMQGAAKLGWIDGIMMSYNYRLMHTDRMKRAVDACVKAGIGLTAMKTQGGGSLSTSTEKELKLASRFLKKGYTDAQAKLKAVWEHPNIASICSEMPNRKILMANVAAALNQTRFTTKDMQSLVQYALKTRSEYCMGCAHICESTVNANIPISDIMRYLMYWRSYDDRNRAVGFFNNIPKEMRSHMGNQDYSQAEKMCPQQMPISKLIREAVTELS
ncbi:MAG: aldo/keto reductase [Desulfobacterales bacterium]|nr:MAG: aldo/keto reductase [Desulfobacterales bacterium]